MFAAVRRHFEIAKQFQQHQHDSQLLLDLLGEINRQTYKKQGLLQMLKQQTSCLFKQEESKANEKIKESDSYDIDPVEVDALVLSLLKLMHM